MRTNLLVGLLVTLSVVGLTVKIGQAGESLILSDHYEDRMSCLPDFGDGDALCSLNPIGPIRHFKINTKISLEGIDIGRINSKTCFGMIIPDTSFTYGPFDFGSCFYEDPDYTAGKKSVNIVYRYTDDYDQEVVLLQVILRWSKKQLTAAITGLGAIFAELYVGDEKGPIESLNRTAKVILYDDIDDEFRYQKLFNVNVTGKVSYSFKKKVEQNLYKIGLKGKGTPIP